MVPVLSLAAIGGSMLAMTGTTDPGFEPDLNLHTGDSDDLEVDVDVTNRTVLTWLSQLDFELQSLTVVDTAEDTYQPGETVELEFTETAHTTCDNAEFMVEVREPGSSTTTISGSDSLSKYGGSVMADQLVTGTVTLQLASDATQGTWEAAGFLWCHDDDSYGNIDGATFSVQAAASEPEPDSSPDSVEDSDETSTDEDTDTDSSGEEPDSGEDGQDQDTDTSDDADGERHWLDQTVLNAWNWLTGLLR